MFFWDTVYKCGSGTLPIVYKPQNPIRVCTVSSILDLFEPKMALFDPPTPKTLPKNQT